MTNTQKRTLLLGFISFIFTFSTTDSFAAIDCGVARTFVGSSSQNWDVEYCATSTDQSELASIATTTAQCLRNFTLIPGQRIGSLSCLRTSSSYNTPANDIQYNESTGEYFICWTAQGLDSIIADYRLDLHDINGNLLCSTEADVERTNLSWIEIFDLHLNGIGIDIIPDGLADNFLFCIDKRVNTAFGCISTDPIPFVSDIIRLSVNIGGAFALVLLLYSFFTYATSAGNPEKIEAAQQTLTAAVVGLIMIILSVVLARLVGVSILGLPGLQ